MMGDKAPAGADSRPRRGADREALPRKLDGCLRATTPVDGFAGTADRRDARGHRGRGRRTPRRSTWQWPQNQAAADDLRPANNPVAPVIRRDASAVRSATIVAHDGLAQASASWPC